MIDKKTFEKICRLWNKTKPAREPVIDRIEDIPRETRLAVLNHAKGHCHDCGEKKPLELHHLRYHTDPSHRSPGGDSIFGKEKPSDLVALCRQCHKQRHIDPDGKWWNDPEEMADVWGWL